MVPPSRLFWHDFEAPEFAFPTPQPNVNNNLLFGAPSSPPPEIGAPTPLLPSQTDPLLKNLPIAAGALAGAYGAKKIFTKIQGARRLLRRIRSTRAYEDASRGELRDTPADDDAYLSELREVVGDRADDALDLLRARSYASEASSGTRNMLGRFSSGLRSTLDDAATRTQSALQRNLVRARSAARNAQTAFREARAASARRAAYRRAYQQEFEARQQAQEDAAWAETRANWARFMRPRPPSVRPATTADDVPHVPTTRIRVPNMFERLKVRYLQRRNLSRDVPRDVERDGMEMEARGRMNPLEVPEDDIILDRPSFLSRVTDAVRSLFRVKPSVPERTVYDDAQPSTDFEMRTIGSSGARRVRFFDADTAADYTSGQPVELEVRPGNPEFQEYFDAIRTPPPSASSALRAVETSTAEAATDAGVMDEAGAAATGADGALEAVAGLFADPIVNETLLTAADFL